MTVPVRDPALCVELGRRPVLGLMTDADWDEQVTRVLGDDDRWVRWPLDVPLTTGRPLPMHAQPGLACIGSGPARAVGHGRIGVGEGPEVREADELPAAALRPGQDAPGQRLGGLHWARVVLGDDLGALQGGGGVPARLLRRHVAGPALEEGVRVMPESLREEAARRGVSVYQVRRERGDPSVASRWRPGGLVVYLTGVERDQLRSIAAYRGVTMSTVVREAVESYLSDDTRSDTR